MTDETHSLPTWTCLDCEADGGAGSLCRASDLSHTFARLADAFFSDGDDRHRSIDCLTAMVESAPIHVIGFLVVAVARANNVGELSLLAGGPLEDLLAAEGPRVIVHLEKIAKVDPRFRLMVSGTWGRDYVEPAVWERLRLAVAPGPVMTSDVRSPGAGMDDRLASDDELAALFTPPVPPANTTRH